jgi:hypothetical protein
MINLLIRVINLSRNQRKIIALSDANYDVALIGQVVLCGNERRNKDIVVCLCGRRIAKKNFLERYVMSKRVLITLVFMLFCTSSYAAEDETYWKLNALRQW